MAGPGGIEAGRAAVIVLPDVSKFGRSLEKYLQRVERTLRVQIPTSLDTTGLSREVEGVKEKVRRIPAQVPLTAQADEFTRQARAAVKKTVAQAQAVIPLTADGEALRRDLDRQVQSLERLTKLTVPLDLGMAANFRADVLAQVAEVERIAQSAAPTIDVGADVQDIQAKVAVEVEKATRSAPKIKIKTDLDRSQTSAANTLTSVFGQLSVSAAEVGAGLVKWGPPIIAALAAAVALAPALAISLPLIAGIGLGVGAVALSMKALTKTFAPLVKAVTALQAPIGKVLTAGLAPLVSKMVTEFVPVLQKGLTLFAGLANSVLKSLLKFTTSSAGLKLIGQLFTGIATAMKPLAGAVTPLVKAFIGIAVAAVPGLTAFSKAVAGVSIKFAAFIAAGLKSGDLTKTISNAVSGAGRLLAGLGNFLGPLAKGLAAIGPSVLTGLGKAFTAVGKAITAVVGFARGIGPALAGSASSFAPFVALFRAVIAVVGQQIQFVKSTILTLAPAFAPFFGLLQAIATTIASNIGPAFAFLRSALQPVIAGIVAFAQAIGPQLLPTFAAVKTLLAALAPTVANFARQFTAVLGPGIAQIGQIIGTQLLPAFRAILPVVTPVLKFLLKVLGSAIVGALSGAIKVIKGLLTAISGIFNVFAGIFTGDWSKAWQGIKQIFSGALQAIVGLVQVFLNVGVLKLFRAGITGIVAIVKGGGPLLLSAGKAILGLLKTGISAGFKLVIALVKSYPKAILAVWSGAKTLLASVGRYIVEGLVAGLRGAAHLVTDAAGAIVNAIPQKVRKLMGIASPSKVMIALGRFVSQGFAAGILADAGKVADAATSLTQKITDAVASYTKSQASIATRIEADRVAVAKATKRYRQVVADHAKSASATVRNAALSLKNANSKYAQDLKDKSPAKALDADRDRIRAARTRYENAVKDQSKSAKRAIDTARESLKTAASKLAKDIGLGKALDLSSGKLATLKGQKLTGLLNYVRIHAKELAKLAQIREAITARLEAAKDKLAQAITLRDDYAKAIADSARAFGSIIAEAAEGKALSAGDVVAQLQAKLAAIRAFRASLDSLRAQGLSNAALQQLVDAGVEAGSATANALAQGGQAAINSVNELTASISQQADSLGTSAAAQFYQAGVDAAQGLVNGLLAQQAALDQAAKKLADALVKQVKKSLGIKSPSTVMASLGSYIGQGLADGIDSSRRLVEAATDRLSKAATPVSADLGLDGGAGVRGGLTLNNTFINPVPETGSESTTRSMRTAARFGFA